MAELENTNPIMGNPGNPINPGSTPEPEQAPDYSQLFSENIAESTPAQSEPAPTVNPVASQPVQEERVTPSNQQTETPAQEQTINFEQEIANTSLDNHTSQEAIEAQRARAEQQKLAWLKEHETKASKSGFAKWILFMIILLLLGFVACSLFAKEQVINAMDYVQSLIPTNSLSFLKKNNSATENTNVQEVDLRDLEESEVVDEENNEEVDPIQEYYDKVDEIISSEDDQETKAELLNSILTEVMQESEEPNEELTQYISQAIMDLTINSEEENVEENIEDQENSEEIDNSEDYNEVSEENSEEALEDTEVMEDDKGYTIRHVDSEEEANWVMPSHCTDLTCYGEDEEFVACTSFRMIETLDENTPRVSSRWGCKYKDASELVYVEFSNTHNSAEDTQSDYSTVTESEPILEMDESVEPILEVDES